MRSNNPQVHFPPAYGPIDTPFTAIASLIAAYANPVICTLADSTLA